jgi:hypothetical protein
MSTALRSVGLLDRLSSLPPRPSGSGLTAYHQGKAGKACLKKDAIRVINQIAIGNILTAKSTTRTMRQIFNVVAANLPAPLSGVECLVPLFFHLIGVAVQIDANNLIHLMPPPG